MKLHHSRQGLSNIDYTEETRKAMRTFDTGATRDSEDGKLDYDGFLSPLTLRRYAEYMHKHREQSDGKMRASDNWQRGIPFSAYIKSLWRHLVDLWAMHRDPDPIYHDDDDTPDDMEEALCAIIFNASGYLHELLKADNNDHATLNAKNWLGLDQETPACLHDLADHPES